MVDLGVVGEGLLHHGRQIDFLIFDFLGRREGEGPFQALSLSSFLPPTMSDAMGDA